MRDVVGLSLGVWLAACGPARAESPGAVKARVSPALTGLFRPGHPVLLRVSLDNAGPAVVGRLDVVVEGVTYRQPVRLGAAARTAVDALVAAQSGLVRVSVVLRDEAGAVRCKAAMDIALGRPADERPGAGALPSTSIGRQEAVQVVAAGRGAEEARRVLGSACCVVVVPEDELPALSAAYAAADAVLLGDDGSRLAPEVRSALRTWVHGGGTLVFALRPGSSVSSDGFLAELGGCSGRASVEAWLGAVSDARQTRHWGKGLAWRAGMGDVVAGTLEGLAERDHAEARAAALSGDVSAGEAAYDAFEGASWGLRLRWRVVGAAVVLLVVGATVAWGFPRRWGRGARGALVVGVSLALAALAWGPLLPDGRGVLEVASIVERGPQGPAGRSTELLCVGGLGRGGIALPLGDAEAIVPLYYSAEDAGTWRDVVLERDAAGRWTLECDVAAGVRRCFVAWSAAPGSADAKGAGGVLVRGDRFAADAGVGTGRKRDWQPLGELRRWGDRKRALVRWQARRTAPRGRVAWASWAEDAQDAPGGRGFLKVRRHHKLLWVEQPEESSSE